VRRSCLASLERIAFQACSFNHLDISPFRINNLRQPVDGDRGDCDTSSNVPRSLTGFYSIAAPLLLARRNDEARQSEISPRTFWNFAREFSSLMPQGATENGADRGHGSAHLLGRPGDPCVLGRRLQTQGPAGAGSRLSVIMPPRDGWADPAGADRLASAQARRAAAVRAVRSAGIACPSAEVHLVRHLCVKRRMGQHPAVFPDVELLFAGPW
jgi:hypothetical protein